MSEPLPKVPNVSGLTKYSTLSIAIELDELLAKLRIMGAANAYSVRLAQAHALSVLDQLSRLLGSDRSDR